MISQNYFSQYMNLNCNTVILIIPTNIDKKHQAKDQFHKPLKPVLHSQTLPITCKIPVSIRNVFA